MLLPKKTKYRKSFKGDVYSGCSKSNTTLSFGLFGLKAVESERITARQIESCRKAIRGYLKRSGKLWINIFPHKPVSKKPAEVRMGGGKGSVEYWAAPVKKGCIMFELDNVPIDDARGAFERAAAKLPIKTKFVYSIDYPHN